ncbi:hypothetical protein EUTSA_v10005246mg [Eutrema salsugineum]|uniref:Uncharacterized protein n=1 Tax=Eutrema salsugineum TaxID=72664 RepID=V4MMB6_EUTSA|nr:hypothetical protein EUTSA_v10005246mg [Eutrema salsugineum]
MMNLILELWRFLLKLSYQLYFHSVHRRMLQLHKMSFHFHFHCRSSHHYQKRNQRGYRWDFPLYSHL